MNPRWIVLLWVGTLTACPPAQDDDDSALPARDDDDAANDDDSARSACDPPLTITPATSRVLPLGLVVHDAEGGEGEYRWDFVENLSGGIINEVTGAYLAGETVEVTDTVRVTDLGCLGDATATVETLSPIDVLPGDLAVPPGTSFRFEVIGGSGVVSCAMQATSASSLLTDECLYTAGNNPGSDVLRIEDEVTGDFVMRQVIVDPDAALTSDSPWIAFPLGGSYQLRFEGGSGVVSLTPDSPGIASFDGERVWGDAAGSVHFEITDSFTGQLAELRVDVVAPLEESPLPFAFNLEGGKVHGEHDLDGDGFRDVVFSLAKAAVEDEKSGTVLVYRGTATGLEAAPVQVLAGQTRDDRMGQSSVVADLDGDGEPDLVVGVPRSDLAGGDSGSVFVHAGVAGGFFSDEPTQTLLGPRGGIKFGRGVAACDFDGDGLVDLALGAHEDEDQTALETAQNQGSVRIHLGQADGLFAPLADQTLWGEYPVDGDWEASGNQNLGRELRAADFDGDGLCDLATSSFGFDGSLSNDQGVVVLYRGAAGGVEADPWMAIAQIDPLEQHNGEFGRSMATGDVDGDGLADLLVGSPRQTGRTEDSGSRRGLAFLYLGSDLADVSSGGSLDTHEAGWMFEGDGNNDRSGYATVLSDLDGDGDDDVILGLPVAEVVDGTGGTGTVMAFLSDGLPSDEPAFEWPGALGNDWFGTFVGTVADSDGDGLDDLFVHALRDDTIGLDVGLPYRVSSSDGGLQALDFPVGAAIREFGSAMTTLAGPDGDRLVVGEDRSARLPDLFSTGAVHVYDPDGVGFSEGPTLEGWTDHDSNDRVGHALAVGDFDGDGVDDLAILAEDDDRPEVFDPAAYANPDACPGFRNQVGSVFVFRGVGGGAIASSPSFVFHGPEDAQRLERLAGGFDANGDGLDDLVIGAPRWDAGPGNDAGGVALLYGRDADPSGVTVICEADWRYDGLHEADSLGESVAAVGDLNGDGCDEFAVGAYREDYDDVNQGTVRLIYGWGPGCAYGGSQAAVIGALRNSSNLGRAMHGGVDVDGDGLPELAVGADNFRVSGSQVGRVVVMPGQWLVSLAVEPLVGGEEPTTLHGMTPDEGSWLVDGRVDEEDFGRSVTLLEGLDGPWGGVVIGGPGGASTGDIDTGGGRVHVYDPSLPGGGIRETPWVVLGGESWNRDNQLGTHTAAGISDGRPWAAFSGPRCDGVEVDGGAVYVLDLTP